MDIEIRHCNNIVRAHIPLTAVNATMFDRLISLALTTRQSDQAWCQSVHNFSIGAAYHR